MTRPSREYGPTTALSTRQREVLDLIADGHGNREIATRLDLTEATVKSHVDKIFEKLGVNGRAHAVAVAFRAGVLS